MLRIFSVLLRSVHAGLHGNNLPSIKQDGRDAFCSRIAFSAGYTWGMDLAGPRKQFPLPRKSKRNKVILDFEIFHATERCQPRPARPIESAHVPILLVSFYMFGSRAR